MGWDVPVEGGRYHRVVYGIDRENRRIIVYAVGHRSEIYKLD